MARHRELAHGERVQIDAHVGDNETGDLRGMTGTVHGVNATYERDGKTFVNIKTADGACVAVPRQALKVKR